MLQIEKDKTLKHREERNEGGDERIFRERKPTPPELSTSTICQILSKPQMHFKESRWSLAVIEGPHEYPLPKLHSNALLTMQ